MPDFERQFAHAIESAERAVFVELIRSNPSLSLAEIAKLGKGRFEGLLGMVTVGELFGGRARPGRKPAAAADSGASNGGGRRRTVNTRTSKGRERYDAAVFAVVAAAKSPIGATKVAAQVGGTALQVRTSLARLIEADKVTWQGQARATKYSVA